MTKYWMKPSPRLYRLIVNMPKKELQQVETQ